ncbi:hypothetical protein MUK42_03383 [Musa troglodytarum]|uniref:Uncharacterized protein n=1 Tax=Musa troglodytarum TaxID=320322 RepID=A0A9E7GLC7_9LILI|nr:hypothetical protein MUK42_03383 [Musa troglodytarum]
MSLAKQVERETATLKQIMSFEQSKSRQSPLIALSQISIGLVYLQKLMALVRTYNALRQKTESSGHHPPLAEQTWLGSQRPMLHKPAAA